MIEYLRRYADTEKNALYGGGVHGKARSGLLNPETLSLFWYSVNGERTLQTCIIPFLHR